jgi:hypothetical protein
MLIGIFYSLVGFYGCFYIIICPNCIFLIYGIILLILGILAILLPIMKKTKKYFSSKKAKYVIIALSIVAAINLVIIFLSVLFSSSVMGASDNFIRIEAAHHEACRELVVDCDMSKIDTIKETIRLSCEPQGKEYSLREICKMQGYENMSECVYWCGCRG